jgi:nuclear pore complex protein Nup62
MAFNFGGTPAPTGAAAAPVPSFSFGSSAASTPAPGSGGFSFGGAINGDKTTGPVPAPPSVGGFSFGGAASTTPAPAAGGISFGGGSSTPVPVKEIAKSAAPAAGGFSFGGGATPALTGDVTPAETLGAGGFSFGGASTPAPAADSSAGGISFGGTITPAAPTPAVEDPVAGGFSFGGAATPAPTPAKDEKTSAAPTAGGFSFGGASTPAPVPAAINDDKAAAAPAAGGFSFGGASAPVPAATNDDKAAAAAAPATGGFSFGGVSAPIPAATNDDKAAAAAPAAGGFSFGGASTPAPAAKDGSDANAGTSLALTTATSVVAPTPTQIEPPPKTYRNQTLEQIINSISSQLEDSTLGYITQARRIAQQDALLRDSQRNISHLSTEVTKLLVQQEELDRGLSQIGDVQDNLNSCLDGLEGQVDTLFERTMTSVGIDDADMERERYFDLAIQTEGRMSHLESVVEDLEKNLKDLQSDHLEGGDLGKVVQVMSRQHDMLSGLESSCARIEADMHLVSRKLTR